MTAGGRVADLVKRAHLYEPASWLVRQPPVTFVRDALSVRRYDRETEARIRGLLAQMVRPGDLCFDVGANLGHRVKVLLELGARVVAVEPQRRCLRILRLRFRRNDAVTIVPYGLNDEEGSAVLHAADAHTLATLSEDWIDAVQASGRFTTYAWHKQELVSLTTLDKLIAQHGVPRYCKIDVEGFEVKVLKGLTQPIDHVCFEFVPEVISSAEACVQHLATLDDYQFNYSPGESFALALKGWVGAEEIQAVLRSYRGDPDWGDVYARRAVLGSE